MTIEIIKLDPLVTPNEFCSQKKNLKSAPDGAGLQIFFKVDDEYYLIAGPRAGGRVTAVNGGKIENAEDSFLSLLAAELNEETFGLMNLEHTKNGYELVLMDGSRHILTLLDDMSALEINKEKHYSYVTFSMVCESFTLEELNNIAEELNPDAGFWNQIGNYLFQQYNEAIPCADFKREYWDHKDIRLEREYLIAGWVKDYLEITGDCGLLVDPLKVFGKDNIVDAFNTLHDLAQFTDLEQMFHHTVGDYSERSSYHVFKAKDLMLAAQNNSPEVENIHGEVAATGYYYQNVITKTFSHVLNCQYILNASLLSGMGLWNTMQDSQPSPKNLFDTRQLNRYQ